MMWPVSGQRGVYSPVTCMFVWKTKELEEEEKILCKNPLKRRWFSCGIEMWT